MPTQSASRKRHAALTVTAALLSIFLVAVVSCRPAQSGTDTRPRPTVNLAATNTSIPVGAGTTLVVHATTAGKALRAAHIILCRNDGTLACETLTTDPTGTARKEYTLRRHTTFLARYPGGPIVAPAQSAIVDVGVGGAESMPVFFGTTHAHTGAFNNHGADKSGPADVFRAAKADGFDFLFLTEHSGHTGPADRPAFYADAKQQADAFTDKSFVGFAGYEYSDNGGDGDDSNGHLTVYGTDDFVNADDPGVDFRWLRDYAVAQSAKHPVIVGFNHPPVSGHNASVPALLTPAARAIYVMTEVENNQGTSGDTQYYKSMIAELDRGWRVAPTCGIDSHGLVNLVKPEPGPCRTGVVAPSLTRQDLLQAMQERRMFATRDFNLQVRYQANGKWMGSIIGTPAAVNFDIEVNDPDTGRPADRIKKIDIVTEHGAVVASHNFDAFSVDWKPAIPAGGKKYFLVRVYNGERAIPTAVAAPVWLE